MTKFNHSYKAAITKLNALAYAPIKQLLKPYLFFFIGCYAFALLFIAPPFFTFDSYHYLDLSLHPVALASHSVGFSYVLLALTYVANILGKSSYLFLYVAYQVLVFSIVHFVLGILSLRVVTQFYPPRSLRERAMLLCLPFVLMLVAMGNLYLMNAVWSEMTNYLQLLCLAFLLYRLQQKWSVIAEIAVLFLVVWAHHTRYLMVTVPVCFGVLAGIILFQRAAQSRQRAFRWARLSVLSFSAIVFSLWVTTQTFPVTSAKAQMTKSSVGTSMQCALRCRVKMFEVDCSTPEGKALIENSRCTEFTFFLVPIGKFRLPPETTLFDLFREVGLGNTLLWIVKAPLVYLLDIHSLEMGYFRFGQDSGMAAYPDVAFYRPYFEGPLGGSIRFLFRVVVRITDTIFSKRGYHILTAALVLLGFWTAIRSRWAWISFLALFGLSQFFLFSYLNHHVPFRYLMIIITPLFVAVIAYVAGSGRPRQAQVTGT